MIDLKKILVPIDFSENNNCAVEYGCELAKQFDAEIHFVHVVYNMGMYSSDVAMIAADTIEEDVAAAKKELAKVPGGAYESLNIKRGVERGAPYRGVINYAKSHEIDLIVISTHGRTGLMHLLMGSVAENIVREAPCPVLTIRPKKHQVAEQTEIIEPAIS